MEKDDMCVAEALSMMADDLRDIAMAMTMMSSQICELRSDCDECEDND